MDKKPQRDEKTPPPFATACYRLISNEQDEPADFLFLDVDRAFEELLCLRRDDVIGRRATEVFANPLTEGFNWLALVASIVRSGQTQETTQWFDRLGDRYKVTIVSGGGQTFATILNRMPLSADQSPRRGQEASDPLSDLEAVFQNTHDAMLLVEYRDGTFFNLRNNAVHKEITGFNNIEGTSSLDLLGQDLGGKLIGYYEQCMRTGQTLRYEQDYDFASGRRFFQTELTPVYGEGGLRYILSASRDVTDLKAAQLQSETLTRRLEAMFLGQTAMMMMVIEPHSGRIVDVNPAACAFYGYSREELLGMRIHDIDTLPQDEVEQHIQQILGETQRYFVFPHRLKNGEVRFIDVYAYPIPEGDSTLLYSIHFDATDRENYRIDLLRERELLSTTLKSIGDGVVTTDNYGVITSLNSIAQELTGWSSNEAVGRLFTEVFRLESEETGLVVENPIQKVLDTGRIVGLANHTVLIQRFGQAVPIADSAAPIRTEGGQIFGVVMVFRDVSKDKEQSEQIRFLSYHDPLTGLYNRRYIEEMMGRLDTARNLPISVIMGDVNGLKITNDVFGHETGDKLLQRVATTLEKSCRRDDFIARWGGDEFVIFLPRTDLSTAEEIIAHIKKSCDAASDGTIQLSLSLGCAVKREANEDLHGVLQHAEEYMYHQKLLDGKSYRNAIINTLLATLYEKSIETEEHAERLKTHCHSIGRLMNLSSKEMDELSLLAILHDIGKVGINQAILQKPGILTPTEWEEMKRHPEIGYRIAQATPELTVVADYILSHHERWDGAGYPRGLKGEEIPLLCRILAVTDAYDAMTNDRAYRRAMSRADAIAELRRHAGTQFDAEVVRLFVETALAGNAR